MNDVVSRDYWPREWPDWPEDPKARKAVEGAFRLGLDIINAPASYRKLRLERAEERAQNYLSQMTDIEREQAGDLVRLWEQNAQIQQDIRYEENKNGIDMARRRYPEWRSAEAQMCRAKEDAVQLDLAGYEYFRSRMERFDIVQEEYDEFGQPHNLPDYSDLRKQWDAREPITEPLPWAWNYMLALCMRFKAGSHRTKKRPIDLKLAIAGIFFTILFGVAGITVAVILDIF